MMEPPFKATHVFTLLDGQTVLVRVEERGDPVAFEEDDTAWHTVMGVMDVWWTCRDRHIDKIASVRRATANDVGWRRSR